MRFFLHPYATLGAGIGILADRVLGDPPHRFDPISAYEEIAGRSKDPGDTRARNTGIAYAVGGTVLGSLSGMGLRRITGPLGAASIAAWSVIRGKSRAARALAVGVALAEGDAERARAGLPEMVQREAQAAADDALAALVVATVAEEMIDGIVGPAMWAAIGGAPGTFAYKSINMLDAKVGHHADAHEKIGIGGTIVDGAANLGPAIVAAAIVAVVRPRAAKEVLQAVRHDAGRYPSRSVGTIVAAFGAALGVRLLDDGPGRTATPEDVPAAVALSRDVSLVLAGACVVVGGIGTIAMRRKATSSVLGRGR